MSYPPQPGQDPNNPYAQQPQQPGYGYPQQQPQQPGYGYPQQQPEQPGYGYGYPQDQQAAYGYPQQQAGLPSYGGPADQGYPMHAGYGVPTEMPGPVKTVRVINFVLGGLAVVGAIALVLIAALFNDALNDPSVTDPDAAAVADLGAGVFLFLALLAAANAVYSFLCAVKAKTGGNGWRIGTIVLGSLSILGGVFSLPTGVINIALGILIIVFMSKAEAKAWYNRPRY